MTLSLCELRSRMFALAGNTAALKNMPKQCIIQDPTIWYQFRFYECSQSREIIEKHTITYTYKHDLSLFLSIVWLWLRAFDAEPPSAIDHFWWSRCKLSLVAFIKVIWSHLRSQHYFANNLRLKTARDVDMVRSSGVIRGHQFTFANNARLKSARNVGISQCVCLVTIQ